MQLISYLLFLAKSTNEHGVHSPFVYDFLTKGIYTKVALNSKIDISIKSKKAIKLFNKTATYFKFKSTSTSSPDDIDCIILDPKKAVINQLKKGNNDTCYVLLTPYKNSVNKAFWQNIKQNTSLHVTIDLFYISIAFKRPQQQKEHFILTPYKTIAARFFEKVKVKL